MKKSKFTKTISFILSVTLIITTVAINVNRVSAYSNTTTTYTCPRTLCSKNLIISGPYGDPNETVDSGVPFLGGMTYTAVLQNHYPTNNDFHMYVIYCPKYNYNDSSLFRDTMTLMFADHGYTTVDYTQHNASQHYANKICDHGTDFKGSNVYALTQTLCGENAYLDNDTLENLVEEYQAQNGCGKETAVLENHNWSYGSWYKNGDNYHSRTKTCVDCGYSTVVSDVHSLTEGSWENSSSTQHKKTTTCSTCDYSKTTYADHQFTYGEWTDNGNGTCSRTKSCSTCGYNGSETKNHSNTKGQWEYYFTEVDTDYSYQEYHKRDTTCSNCGSTGMDFELHTFTEFTPWESYSEARHQRSKYCTVCGYTMNYTDYHHFLTTDYSYEDNGDGTHTVTKPCAECGYITTETVEHNYVIGEWFDYDSENPYEETYESTKYHQRDNVCSDCGNVVSEHAEHEWYWETDEWLYSDEERHRRTKVCSGCGYRWGYVDYHHFNSSNYTYEVYSDEQHTVFEPCNECVYIKEELATHSFTSVFTAYSETHHKHTQTCVCGYEDITYSEHLDDDSDCYCDDCGYLMTKFSVTVPTTMNFVMSKTGEVYSADNVQILNNSTSAVSVKQVNLETLNGWSLTAYDETAIASAKVDSKIIGLKLNTAETATAGTTDSFILDDWIIEKDTSLPIPYDAVVSATSTPIENEQVMNVVFIVDWKE